MKQNISIEMTHEKFVVTFFGVPIHTTVTSSASAVENWLYRMRHVYHHKRLRGRLIVGLGVQWRPSYMKGVFYPAATLQLCIGRNCLIFQLLYKNAIPKALVNFLGDPSATFVGVWNGRDALKLKKDHGLNVRTLDLRFLIAEYWNSPELLSTSMETLTSVVLGLDGVEKPRSIGMSEWDARQLSLEQVQYACVDAHVSFLLGKTLNVGFF